MIKERDAAGGGGSDGKKTDFKSKNSFTNSRFHEFSDLELELSIVIIGFFLISGSSLKSKQLPNCENKNRQK